MISKKRKNFKINRKCGRFKNNSLNAEDLSLYRKTLQVCRVEEGIRGVRVANIGRAECNDYTDEEGLMNVHLDGCLRMYGFFFSWRCRLPLFAIYPLTIIEVAMYISCMLDRQLLNG